MKLIDFGTILISVLLVIIAILWITMWIHFALKVGDLDLFSNLVLVTFYTTIMMLGVISIFIALIILWT